MSRPQIKEDYIFSGTFLPKNCLMFGPTVKTTNLTETCIIESNITVKPTNAAFVFLFLIVSNATLKTLAQT